MSSKELEHGFEEEMDTVASHSTLNDPLVRQIRVVLFVIRLRVQELNKKLLMSEQEKEKLKSELESIKSLFCQVMRIKNPERVLIAVCF